MPDILIDTVRASKDGHQFHEAWVARCALGLLLSRNALYAIAVEGLSEEDEEDLSDAAVEIADVGPGAIRISTLRARDDEHVDGTLQLAPWEAAIVWRDA